MSLTKMVFWTQWQGIVTMINILNLLQAGFIHKNQRLGATVFAATDTTSPVIKLNRPSILDLQGWRATFKDLAVPQVLF